MWTRLKLWLLHRRIKNAEHWTDAAQVAYGRLLGTARLFDELAVRDDLPRYLRALVSNRASDLRKIVEAWNELAVLQLKEVCLCSRCDGPLDDRGDGRGMLCVICGLTAIEAAARTNEEKASRARQAN